MVLKLHQLIVLKIVLLSKISIKINIFNVLRFLDKTTKKF